MVYEQQTASTVALRPRRQSWLQHGLLLLAVCLNYVGLIAQTWAADEVKQIAVLAHRGEAKALAQWWPTAEYLSQAIPGYHFAIVPVTNDTIGPLIEEGGVDFVLTNPASYVGLEARYGITRIATLRNKRMGGAYNKFGAVIFSRSDRDDITELKSLQGKTFMAVHPNAFGGWWMAWQQFRIQGIEPGREFKRLTFSGFPQDRVVEAVAKGLVDAGTVRTDTLERMSQEGKIDLRQFKILAPQTAINFPFYHSTPLYPEWPFAVTQHVSEDLASEVVIALLSMTEDTAAAHSAHIAGWTTPLDYQPVHELMKALRVGVYRNVGNVTLWQALKEVWPWLLAVVVVLLLFVTAYVLRLNHTLSRSRESLAKVLFSIGDGVITTDSNGVIDYFNPVAEQLIGMDHGEVKGCHYLSVLNLVDGATGEALDDLVELSLMRESGIVHAENGMLKHRDGGKYAIRLTVAPIRNQSSEVNGAVIVLHDLTEVLGMTQQLKYQATHDMLTGLVNRREFESRLERAIRAARTGKQRAALFYMDLDQFKVVNDTCGHQAGDELLRQLTSMLLINFRDTDTLARLGGDEFGVLLNGCPLGRAMTIAEDMLKEVRAFRFVWDDKTFRIGASIGLVNITASSSKLTDIMSAADAACYVAKEQGGNRIQLYDDDDDTVLMHYGEMQWVHRITEFFEKDRFVLYAQEIAPLPNTDDGDAPRYEVLIRISDEDGKIIEPAAFIPAAERYNLMPMIDRWVVRTAFGKLREAQGPDDAPPIHCSINLSGQTLCDDYFLEFVLELFYDTGIPGESICFEVTETAAIANLSRAMNFIDVLKKKGCSFALDDFGSGLSSFGYLKGLDVDYLKIDGGFIKDMVSDVVDRAMVNSINQIGQVMGLKTIGEYVENGAIIIELEDIGVDYIQGYFVGEPRPLDAILNAVQPLEKTNTAILLNRPQPEVLYK